MYIIIVGINTKIVNNNFAITYYRYILRRRNKHSILGFLIFPQLQVNINESHQMQHKFLHLMGNKRNLSLFY